MKTALWISLMAVAIALIPVFIATKASKAKANAKKSGDSGTTPVASDSGSDCSPGHAGGCDGGGGGGGGD